VYGPPLALERYMLYPDTAELLAVQASMTECETVCVAVPEMAIVAGEFVALLAMVTLPVRFPEAVGENVTSSVALCPGVRIKPAETPLADKAGLVSVTLEMVTSAFPVFETATPKVLLAPMVTFPKLRLAGLALRRIDEATAVPLTVTFAGELDALLMTETVPDAAPMVLGEKTTVRFDCWPAAIVIGNEPPVIVNPFEEALACVTIRLDTPPLEIVTD